MKMKQWFEQMAATMKAKGKRLHTVTVFVGVIVLVLTLATAVQAGTTPTVYYACVSNSTGVIHMTTATGTCSSKEHKISWNNIGNGSDLTFLIN